MVSERPSQTTATTKLRLLIVDDDVAIRRVLERMFGKEYAVTTEERATSALARITAGQRFDVILTDLMMPEMTGMHFHDEVLAVNAEQASRMIFMTGTSFDRAARAFLDGFAGRWIDKPFDREALRELIRKMARPST